MISKLFALYSLNCFACHLSGDHIVESFSSSSITPCKSSGPLCHQLIRPSPSALAATERSRRASGNPHGPIVAEITSPDELKEFVTEDDRLAVIKVYADWCKTCKQFDLRYRKIALQWGEMNGSTSNHETEFSNCVRFAQMEYRANEEMCKQLGATKVPFILIYRRGMGKLEGFKCPPSQAQSLVDALHEHVANEGLTAPVSVIHAREPNAVKERNFRVPLSMAESTMVQNDDSQLIMEFDRDLERALAEGSALLDPIIGEMQKEVGGVTVDATTSFEEFCLEQATKQ